MEVVVKRNYIDPIHVDEWIRIPEKMVFQVLSDLESYYDGIRFSGKGYCMENW